MLLRHWPSALLGVLSICSQSALATIDLTLDSSASVTSALQTIAGNIMSTYQGNLPGQIPGLWPYNDLNGQRMYWWESGAAWGTMIDYWYYTGDDQYNADITQALLFQATTLGTFEPVNQTLDLGNDDQAFWAFTVLQAAEYNFPNPPSTDFQWLELSQAVFNRQASRWSTDTCGGGLHWQVNWWAPGYDYKNAPSNGGLFLMASRLAKFTGNNTYSDWAEKVWDWMDVIGLIDSNYLVYDGTSTPDNCTTINHVQWTYNPAMLAYGAAIMWNITNSPTWYSRAEGLIKGMATFFPNNILTETACEFLAQSCDEDQQSFKGYTARWLAAGTRVAPWTYDLVSTWLSTSAMAAAATCTGGDDGTWCGLKWGNSTFDGVLGTGEQMNALDVIGAQAMYGMPGILSANTGATSKGNPSAGNAPPLVYPGAYTNPITTGDRIGAVAATGLVGLVLLAGAIFMMME